jgi:hypothetical protein
MRMHALVVLLLAACGGGRPAVPGAPLARDRDGDGIPDDRDQCPDQPEDRDGFQDEDGCPDPDNDHDRIPDVRDKCPNDAEVYNGYEDEDGCPDKGCVLLRGTADCVEEPIWFAHGATTLDFKLNPMVDLIANAMRELPVVQRLRVRGHREAGEPVGASLLRAHAVQDALIVRGIPPERLELVDLGAVPPSARVDFEIAAQLVSPDEADDVMCSPFGVVAVKYTPEQKRARCKR